MNPKKTLIAALALSVGALALQPAIASAAGKDPEKRIARLLNRADLNGDGKVSKAEVSRQIARTIAFLDADRNGVLTEDELKGQRKLIRAENKRIRAADAGPRMMKLPKAVKKHFDRFDANGDGRLTAAELDRIAVRMFEKRDRNGDGFLTREDFAA